MKETSSRMTAFVMRKMRMKLFKRCKYFGETLSDMFPTFALSKRRYSVINAVFMHFYNKFFQHVLHHQAQENTRPMRVVWLPENFLCFFYRFSLVEVVFFEFREKMKRYSFFAFTWWKLLFFTKFPCEKSSNNSLS